MAIARVQRKGTGTVTAATVTSHTLTYDSATTAGNYLIAVVHANNAGSGTPTITPPSGWTAVAAEQYNNSFILAAYYKVADGSETSVTWSVAATVDAWRIVMDISEYSGVGGIEKAQYGPLNTSTVNGVCSLDWPTYKDSAFLHCFSHDRIQVGTEPTLQVEYGAAITTWQWHRTGAADTVYASLLVNEHIGSGSFEDWVDVSTTSGSSNNGTGGSLGFILTPTSPTATTALSSGTGSATHVQSVQSSAAGTGTSQSLTFAAAVAGNLLFAAMRGPDPDTNTVTPPTGWSEWSPNVGTFSFWYKIAVGGETGVTWSWVSAVGNRRLVGCEFSGVQAGPVEQLDPVSHTTHSASVSSSPDQNPYGGPLKQAVTSGDVLHFLVVSVDGTGGTFVGDDGFTFRVKTDIAGADLLLFTKASLVPGIPGGRVHSTANPNLMGGFSNFLMTIEAQPSGAPSWGWGVGPTWQVV